MSKKFGCGIILDLLPLYIDGMTSDETGDIIREHLQECKKCRQVYASMTEELDVYPVQEKKKKRRRHKYKKKSVGRMLILGYILLLLLIMALCVLDVALFI